MIMSKYGIASIVAVLGMVCHGIFGVSAAIAQSETPAPVEAVEIRETYMRAVVDEVLSDTIHEELPGDALDSELSMQVLVRFVSGENVGEQKELPYTQIVRAGDEPRRLAVGDQVIVVRSTGPAGEEYYISEINRLPVLAGIIGIFAFLVILLSGRRGVMAFAGLLLTLMIIVRFMVPQIATGKNPLLVSLVGTMLISVISVLVAHGRSARIYIALASMLATVLMSFGLAGIVIDVAELFGTGSEAAFFLQSAPLGYIDLRGLLLGSMIVGLLGVLDDSTTAQAAAVDEIYAANPTVSWRELYRRGMSVGREHITALVNTLALAYAGASLPLLLLFVAYPRPWWVTLNSEPMAEELIRTMVGSFGLLVAVPLTTLIAAVYFARVRPARKNAI